MNPRKPRQPCPVCTTPVENLRAKFCSNACQMEQQYQTYIKRWLTGEVTGGTRGEWETLSDHVRRYMIERAHHRCEECGWDRVHPTTGRSPLTVDHQDGNAQNNALENLRVLCPNCHALTPTYGGLNRGKGRPGRRSRYVKGGTGGTRTPDLQIADLALSQLSYSPKK